MSTIERGSFYGQSTLTRQATAGSTFALDEVTVIRVQREAIEKVLHKNPLLLQEFGRAIDERRSEVLKAMRETAAAAASQDAGASAP